MLPQLIHRGTKLERPIAYGCCSIRRLTYERLSNIDQNDEYWAIVYINHIHSALIAMESLGHQKMKEISALPRRPNESIEHIVHMYI